MPPLVDVRGLVKRYGDRRALDGVALRVDAGQVVGLIGANGSGKTTTMRILAGLLTSDEGEGRVLDRSLPGSLAANRAQVSYVTQSHSLYPELSVHENLRWRAAIFGLARPAERVASVLGSCGLDPYARTPVAKLSGGWARRAQFAACILHHPRLLLLDEPTAGLDPVARRGLWRLIEAEAARGAAVLVSTHDVIEAVQCDRLVVLAGGRLIVEGSAADLAGGADPASLDAALREILTGAGAR